jgi:hypothetical protein
LLCSHSNLSAYNNKNSKNVGLINSSWLLLIIHNSFDQYKYIATLSIISLYRRVQHLTLVELWYCVVFPSSQLSITLTKERLMFCFIILWSHLYVNAGIIDYGMPISSRISTICKLRVISGKHGPLQPLVMIIKWLMVWMLTKWSNDFVKKSLYKLTFGHIWVIQNNEWGQKLCTPTTLHEDIIALYWTTVSLRHKLSLSCH